METEKGLSGQKLNLDKKRLTEADISALVSTLAQQVDQMDGIVRCLTEQQYDFSKKLKQIDLVISQGNGVLIDDDDNKLEHLNSLTKLAERTLVEADKLAESVRKEIEDKAKAEAAKIVAAAEDRAKSEADRIISEAKQSAKEAASEEAQNILGGINEIKGIFDKAYQKVLTNLGEPEIKSKTGD